MLDGHLAGSEVFGSNGQVDLVLQLAIAEREMIWESMSWRFQVQIYIANVNVCKIYRFTSSKRLVFGGHMVMNAV